MSDLISREALQKELAKLTRPLVDLTPAGQSIYNMAAAHAMLKVEEAPAVDAEPVRHGLWKEEIWTKKRQRVCSVCISTVRQPSYDQGEIYLFKYCPYCGAKMDNGGAAHE